MAQSGICDAICNVREDELQEIEGLVSDLTRQLRVAIGVRDALAGKTTLLPVTMQDMTECCGGETTVEPVAPEQKAPGHKPGRKSRQVPEFERKPNQPKRPIEATEKTLQIGKLLQRRGPLSKEAIADALGWKFHQAIMVIGRSAKHFTRLDDGRIDVAPALAKLL